jgi:hypothetical protein
MMPNLKIRKLSAPEHDSIGRPSEEGKHFVSPAKPNTLLFSAKKRIVMVLSPREPSLLCYCHLFVGVPLPSNALPFLDLMAEMSHEALRGICANAATKLQQAIERISLVDGKRHTEASLGRNMRVTRRKPAPRRLQREVENPVSKTRSRSA